MGGAESTTLGHGGALDSPRVSRDELMMGEIATRYRRFSQVRQDATLTERLRFGLAITVFYVFWLPEQEKHPERASRHSACNGSVTYRY